MYSGTCCRRIALSCQPEDADSPEGEGAFYLWTADELQSVLGPDGAALAALAYNVVPEGNFFSQETREGQNILYRYAFRWGMRITHRAFLNNIRTADG